MLQADSENFCLKWNDFVDNVTSSFGQLRTDKDFSDVTLVSGDGHQIKAHRLALASGSLVFKGLLSQNSAANPVIFLRGVKSGELNSIVDFLYLGETNIHQEHLDSFMAIAEELQLKGLMGQNKSGDGEVVEKMTAASEPTSPMQVFKRESQVSKAQDLVNIGEHASRNYEADKTVALTANFSGDLQDLDEQVKSLMEKTPNATADGVRRLYACKVCGKEGQSIHIKNHIEAIHLEGISIPCNYCGKTTRSRKELTAHKHQLHKSNPM